MKTVNKKTEKYPYHVKIIRRISKPIIIEYLEEKSYTLNEITDIIKKNLSKSCDDSIICECKGGGVHPEWKHQVRWALQDLKSVEKIQFKKTHKTYLKFSKEKNEKDSG